MDILSYLAEVIQTHREVGIPELGTFFKKKLPGRYDAELRSFIPPSYQLEYTTEVTEDVLLSKYISQLHHISIESAVYHIDLFVANLKEKLGEEKEVDLKQLGRFVLIDSELIYEADPNLNLGLKYFGLPGTASEITNDALPAAPKEEIADENLLEAITLENNIEEENPGNVPPEEIYEQEPEALKAAPIAPVLPPVVAESKAVEAPVIAVETPLQPIIAATTPTAPEAINYPLEAPVKSATPTYLKVIIAILALLTIGMGLFLWKPDLFQSAGPLQNKLENSPLLNENNPVPLTTDTLSQPDSLQKDTLKQNVASPDVAVKDTAPAAVTVAKPIATGPVTYEVIGSSVYGEKEAAYFIETMKRKWGLQAKIVSQRPGKKIKISIASYKDEKTARLERARLEEKIGIPGLYIYINTHKPE